MDQPEKVDSAQVALGDERSTGNPRCWSLRNWLVGVVDVPGRERGHTSYLSFLLHWQDFRKPNFTPKKRLKAPKTLKMSLKSQIYAFFHSIWKNLHLVPVTNMRYERGDIENRLTLVVGSHRGRGPATCIEFCEDTKQNTSHIMFNRRDKNEKHTFSLLFSWIRALHD